MSWIERFDTCKFCFHCKWMHNDIHGECKGTNESLDNSPLGRSGCKYNCQVFSPITEEDLNSTKPSTFELDREQMFIAHLWSKTHPCKYRGKYMGAIGGGLTYTFTHTSIGTIVGLECSCGDKVDISGAL